MSVKKRDRKRIKILDSAAKKASKEKAKAKRRAKRAKKREKLCIICGHLLDPALRMSEYNRDAAPDAWILIDGPSSSGEKQKVGVHNGCFGRNPKMTQEQEDK